VNAAYAVRETVGRRIVLTGGLVVAVHHQFRRCRKGGAIRRCLLHTLLILMVADVRRKARDADE
jgi:hypothetical protein